MHSPRAALVVLLTFLTATASAIAADRADQRPAHRPGGQTVGLFNFGFDKQVAEKASPPESTQPQATSAKTTPGPGTASLIQPPASPAEMREPVILTQGLEPTIADPSAELPVVVTAADQADVELDPMAARTHESTWYTRIDYFQWQEVHNGKRFMENDGVAPTVGWQRRQGHQRYRFDFFGARPDYSATIAGTPVNSVADYLGVRGEYELLWEPAKTPYHTFFAGVGTRYFVRSFPDVVVNNKVYFGYQEAWWTFYPYLGFERKRTLRSGFELFAMSRFGMTAFTREHITHGDVTLFPRPNLTYQSELGIRGPRLSMACFVEYMGWSQSPQVLNYSEGKIYNIRQPESLLLTLGGRVAWSY